MLCVIHILTLKLLGTLVSFLFDMDVMEKIFNPTLLFHKTIEITRFWKSHPFRLNPEQDTLLQIPIVSFKKLSAKCRFFSLIPFVIVAQTLIAEEPPSLMNKIKICISFLGLSTISIHLWACLDKAVDIISYVNGILQFLRVEQSRKLGRKSLGIIGYLNILFVYGMHFTIVTFPAVFVYGLHRRNPCICSLVGFWMIPECYNRGHFENLGNFNFLLRIAAKIGILVANQIAWSFGIYGTAMVVVGLQILLIMMLTDCLRIFWGRLKHSRACELLKAWQLHRQLQILGDLNNYIQQGSVLIVTIINGIILHALSFSSVVRMFKFSEGVALPKIPFSVFLLVTVDSVLLIIVTFGGMSAVYRESKSIIKRKAMWHMHICFVSPSEYSRMELKWQEKFYKSCPLIKVKFGYSNFIEELTPLNCMNTAVGMAVQLLLLRW